MLVLVNSFKELRKLINLKENIKINLKWFKINLKSEIFRGFIINRCFSIKCKIYIKEL